MIDRYPSDYKPRNDTEEKNWKACKYPWTLPYSKGLTAADDAGQYHGAPASIQIMGRRLEEEKLFAIATVVVAALKEREQQAKPGASHLVA